MWHLKNEISFNDKSIEDKLKKFVNTILPENDLSVWVAFFQQLFEGHRLDNSVPILFIEGNIGSGKTTLLGFFKKQSKHIKLVDEPLYIWEAIVDASGKNILARFYESIESNDAEFVLKFELAALFTRVIVFLDAVYQAEHYETKLFISERSIFTDRYFYCDFIIFYLPYYFLCLLQEGFSWKICGLYLAKICYKFTQNASMCVWTLCPRINSLKFYF